jgi:hypothetical protein
MGAVAANRVSTSAPLLQQLLSVSGSAPQLVLQSLESDGVPLVDEAKKITKYTSNARAFLRTAKRSCTEALHIECLPFII